MLAAIVGLAGRGLRQEGLSWTSQTSFCGKLGQDKDAVPGVETQRVWEHRRAPYTPQLHQAEVGTRHKSWGEWRASRQCSPSISPRPLGLRPHQREVQIQEADSENLKLALGSREYSPSLGSGGHSLALGSGLGPRL